MRSRAPRAMALAVLLSQAQAWAANPVGAPAATPIVSQATAQLAAQMNRGKVLFTQTQPACAVCHTLAAAGSEGQVGPVLDELKPDADRVRKVLRTGLGAMPSFADKLSAADVEALAVFVSRSTGGAPTQ